MPLTALPLPDAELAFDPQWLLPAQADALLASLRDTIAWQVHRVRLFGREHRAPRLSAWIGDADAAYGYSGTRHVPAPWPAALGPVRERLRDALGVDFNGVLANLYRDGSDTMGWHADDERELGPAPVIASLSLGATRRFVLKHRTCADVRLAIELPHGSLLVMSGATQQHHRHALPRTARPIGERLNLTFRRIAQPG
ncbi:alpha-ketoglutarate-dependent dioxygenase AlkB family protein [Cognatilysobacter bugurensis]|uniref:DNA methylase n=1 Tax=Cognatilysobacter bugurensis TaxID=543356 RepID=A0A918W8F7_9GAMM|nr:alpha-ketoglutarate-dependent dioxygenase AlkB [Lysobacter bugurensis]GHA85555.1 DNA methylase [Lysobacter bugurensis]